MRTNNLFYLLCILITNFSVCFSDQSYNAPFYLGRDTTDQYRRPSTWGSIQNIADHAQVNVYESDQWNRPYYQDTYEDVSQSSSTQKQSDTPILLRPVKWIGKN